LKKNDKKNLTMPGTWSWPLTSIKCWR